MKLFYKIPAALLGVAATLALVQPQIAVGLSSEEVGKIAQEITVRIVIETPGTYTIITHAGRRYRVNANQDMCMPGIDLAMLRFTSTQSYRVANLGDSSQLVVGRKIYVSGWISTIGPSNEREREYRFRDGNIASTESKTGEGYSLVHTSIIIPGMSGGPILDEQGDVVGINGLAIRVPLVGATEFFGIPINIYKPIYPSPTNYVLANTLKGHSSSVTSVAISPDGKLLASGSWDKTIKIWNLGSGRLLRTLTGHSNLVISVAISPDGQLLASGSNDKTIKIWNLGSGRLLRTLTGDSDWVWSVAISPDGQLLASGSRDKTIKIWNLGSSRLLRTLTGHSYSVTSVAFSPDGQLLASGSRDDTIKIWNLGSGRLLRTLTGHSSFVNSVAFSPDGQLLASGSDDDTIKIWNLGSGRLLRTLTGHSGSVSSVAISPDGQLLASGSRDDTIKIWNLGSSRLLRTLTGHSYSVTSVAFSPDGQTIVSGGGCDWSGCNED
ncbi:MAG: trypsin-like peptidase domain-containing protein [Hormoscilla sp. GUM202]|nr:trypsin-like peptidase domain-containing protein [Hormoscilla sp. GUM202]